MHHESDCSLENNLSKDVLLKHFFMIITVNYRQNWRRSNLCNITNATL